MTANSSETFIAVEFGTFNKSLWTSLMHTDVNINYITLGRQMEIMKNWLSLIQQRVGDFEKDSSLKDVEELSNSKGGEEVVPHQLKMKQT